MRTTKITVLSAIAVAMLGTASFAIDDGPSCLSDECGEAGGNPGNAKPVGNSRYDGITGRSGKNLRDTPSAAPMVGQEDDAYPQPGGGGGPSGN